MTKITIFLNSKTDHYNKFDDRPLFCYKNAKQNKLVFSKVRNDKFTSLRSKVLFTADQIPTYRVKLLR